MECTAENLRWRKNIRTKLDHALDPTEFHNLSRLALSYAIGLPTKAVERKEQRDQLLFITTHGYVPWDARAPAAARLNARSAQMITDKSEEIALQAETRAAEAVVIDVPKGDPDAEVLEVVVPPPEDPGAHGGGGRGR
jgi:hypothetical protein